MADSGAHRILGETAASGRWARRGYPRGLSQKRAAYQVGQHNKCSQRPVAMGCSQTNGPHARRPLPEHHLRRRRQPPVPRPPRMCSPSPMMMDCFHTNALRVRRPELEHNHRRRHHRPRPHPPALYRRQPATARCVHRNWPQETGLWALHNPVLSSRPM
jgi:hypothetical protein